MDINKEKTISFTGYRMHKILRSTREPDIIKRLSEELEQTINTLVDQGYTTFLSGMAEGFDMLAAEVVLRIRMKRPDIKLIAVVPFQGQELGYTPLDKERYKIICELANKIVFTSQLYHDKAYFTRNDYLLDNSSLLVCYYNGQRGGTMYTYNRAVSNNKGIINLWRTTKQYIKRIE